jgi:phytoene dehydrogenase-like protein
VGNEDPFDAVVVGAGPNGLAAAIALAREGRRVTVFEARDSVGGGARSAELTLPGFIHDVCSAIHPLVVASPFLRSLPLTEHGLEWIHPPVAVAHPFDDGTAAVLAPSFEETGATLGADARAWQNLMEPLARSADALLGDVLAPLRLPRHPVLFAQFGFSAMRSGLGLARSLFNGERARGLFAGIAAHSIVPLDFSFTAAAGVLLGLVGHAAGWPLPRGGAQAISEALAGYLRSLGGEVATGRRVGNIDELQPARTILLDVSPRQFLALAGDRLPERYKRGLSRYRYGPAAFKIDWALSEPIPWKAPECAKAGTIHLGGTIEEIVRSEADAWEGRPSEWPFVLLAQPSRFDISRAPSGRHTAWAYCHVPNGSNHDMAERIEGQVERFAPGFRDLIIGRHVMAPSDFEAYNANDVGGDITGGANDFRQLFARPVLRFPPYSTPIPGVYLCSASTPPGGGVHGMCGYHAARAALRAGG